jgi:hypothetical protein
VGVKNGLPENWEAVLFNALSMKFLFFVKYFLNRQAREDRKENLLKAFALFAILAVSLFGFGLSELGICLWRRRRFRDSSRSGQKRHICHAIGTFVNGICPAFTFHSVNHAIAVFIHADKHIVGERAYL